MQNTITSVTLSQTLRYLFLLHLKNLNRRIEGRIEIDYL